MSSFQPEFRFRLLNRILTGLASVISIFAIIVSSLVAFGTAKPPTAIASETPAEEADRDGLPATERYRASDGAELSFRYYPAESKQVIFLIHGAAGSSADMNIMALALQASGVAVYVPDLRGHGANFPHGDVSYSGQLDDDLADFLHFIQPKHPDARLTLIGFSSGGGFALRVAASRLGQTFDQYVLLSPFLGRDSPTNRKVLVSHDGKGDENNSGGPMVSTGRIVGLMILDGIGVHRFDHLPVIHFPVPANDAEGTSTYSWRMQESFQPHDDFRSDIRSVSSPMTVFVGADDERFRPEAFKPVFDAERNDIPVFVLPGLNHSDMAIRAAAVRSVIKTIKSSTREELH